MERMGIPTYAAGMPVAGRLRAFRERFGADLADLPPPQRRAFAFAAHFGYLAAPSMLEDLERIAKEWTPDVIVHEPAELAAPAVAAVLGVPHATVAFSGAIPDGALAAAAEAVAPLWDRLGHAVPTDLGLYEDAYFHPFAPSMGQRPSAPRVHDLRPGATDGAAGPVPSWVEELSTARPLIYVTFGTEMGPLAPWSTLIPALADLGDANVVVTVGSALDLATLGPLPDHMRVERYVPQSWLLPRCALVVSHAGAGTLLATAVQGVPQLLVPLGADQFENTGALVGTGAGRSGFGLDVDALSGEIRALLNDGPHRRAAADLAAEFASMPGTERAVSVVESLSRSVPESIRDCGI